MSVQTHGKASVQGVKLIDSATRASKVRTGTHGSIEAACMVSSSAGVKGLVGPRRSGAPWVLCSSLHPVVLHGPC